MLKQHTITVQHPLACYSQVQALSIVSILAWHLDGLSPATAPSGKFVGGVCCLSRAHCPLSVVGWRGWLALLQHCVLIRFSPVADMHLLIM